MDEADVQDKLQARVRAAVQASTLPTLPIAYIGVTFDPPNDTKWLEIIEIANNRQPFLRRGRLIAGSLRLLLHWPSDGAGAMTPMKLCTSIAAHLPKGSRFEDITITQAPVIGSPVATDRDVLYPMTMRYEYLTLQ